MKQALIIIAAVLVAGLLYLQPWSQGPTVPAMPSEQSITEGLLPVVRIENRVQVPATLAERMAAYSVPGVSIAVMQSDKIVLAVGQGVALRGGSDPVTPETVFQAASISKPAFATILMRYRDTHPVDLDAPINSLLTSWQVPDHDWSGQEPVTLRRLLSHTAGTTVHGFGGYPAGVPVPTLVGVLEGAEPANSPAVIVDLEPGTQFRYSGGGTTLAQLAFEDLSGMSVSEAAPDHLFARAGMTNSSFTQPLEARYRAQAAHPHGADGMPIEGGAHTYAALAAAGLWTTPSDILKWAASVRKAAKGTAGEIVSPEAARDMLTNPVGPVGIGFFIDVENGVQSFGHGGSNAGFRSNFFVYTESGDGIAVMTNGDQGSPLIREIIQRAAEVYGWADVQPPTKRALDLAPEALGAYTGTYRVPDMPGSPATVIPDGSDLIFEVEGLVPRTRFYGEVDDRFFAENGAPLTFDRDEAGAVIALQYFGIRAERTAAK